MHQFDNQHAERAAAATVLQNPDFLTEMDGKLDLAAFKNPANRAIIQMALELYNKGYTRFDKELLRNKITMMPVPGIENYQMQNYVEALLTADIESVNFSNYVGELREAHLKDSLHRLLNRSIEEVGRGDSASAMLGRLQSELYDMDSGINRNDEPVDIGKGIRETIYGLVDNPLVGIPTGIDILDEMTLGWIPKKFYFIGARPGEGKSALLLQCSSHAAYFAPKAKRVPVLYLDTEIDQREFKIRLTGHLAGVDTKIIQQGLWVKDEKMKQNVDRALYFVEKIGGIYHKEMPGYTLSDVVNTIRKYVYTHGIGLVIFDYIEEPTGEGDTSARWEKVGLVARTLKKYAQILEIPIVAALQQNREGADKSRVSSRMYAESDDVYKKADGAMALNRKSAEEIRKETIDAGTHRLQILKGRYHATSYNGLNLKYVGYCLRFWPARLQAIDQQDNNEHDGEARDEQSQIPVATDHPTGPLVP
jgi:replicative DNA helicase